MIFAQVKWLILVFVILLLLFLIAALVLGLYFFRPWLRAFLSGRPISLFQIIGMRFRKVNPDEIITHGIATAQGGHPVDWAELERAYLQGVDLNKVATAYVTAKQRGDDFSFAELVNAERESRLEEMLNR